MQINLCNLFYTHNKEQYTMSNKSKSVEKTQKDAPENDAQRFTELFIRMSGKHKVGKADPRYFDVTVDVHALTASKVDELILRTAVRSVQNIASVEVYSDVADFDNSLLLQAKPLNDAATEWEVIDVTDDSNKIDNITVNADPKKWYRASVRGIIRTIRILAPAAKGGGGRTATPLDPEVEKYIENLDPDTQKSIARYIRRQAAKGSKVKVTTSDDMQPLNARRATED
jgi:hypothetical protein